MSNFLLVGSGSPVFGTADVGYTAIGVIVSSERADKAEKLLIKDRYGNVQMIVYFNLTNECTIDVIFDSTVTLPTIGDALSLCNLTLVHCDEITFKWENEKNKMVTIKATKYALMTV